jgi:hypothetical protein
MAPIGGNAVINKLLALVGTLLIPMLLPIFIKKYGLTVPARKWVVWYAFWLVMASLVAVQILTMEHVLSVEPRMLDFGQEVDEISIVVANTGSGVIRWDIQNDLGWISFFPISGAVGTNRETVRVTVDRSLLSQGTTSGSFLVVGRTGENATVEIRVVT